MEQLLTQSFTVAAAAVKTGKACLLIHVTCDKIRGGEKRETVAVFGFKDEKLRTVNEHLSDRALRRLTEADTDGQISRRQSSRLSWRIVSFRCAGSGE